MNRATNSINVTIEQLENTIEELERLKELTTNAGAKKSIESMITDKRIVLKCYRK